MLLPLTLHKAGDSFVLRDASGAEVCRGNSRADLSLLAHCLNGPCKSPNVYYAAPYGFRRAYRAGYSRKTHLVPDLEARKLGDLVVRWHRGGMGYKKIAAYLNSEGVRNPKAKNKKKLWDWRAVAALIKNELTLRARGE